MASLTSSLLSGIEAYLQTHQVALDVINGAPVTIAKTNQLIRHLVTDRSDSIVIWPGPRSRDHTERGCFLREFSAFVGVFDSIEADNEADALVREEQLLELAEKVEELLVAVDITNGRLFTASESDGGADISPFVEDWLLSKDYFAQITSFNYITDHDVIR